MITITYLKRTLYLFALALFLNGCPVNEPSGPQLQSFGWKPDGTAIITVNRNSGVSPYVLGFEVETFDLQGNSINKIVLANGVSSIAVSDKLYFAPDRKSFYAQINNDIFTVDPDNGNQTLLIPNEQFLGASASGKVILTRLTFQAVQLDSQECAIHFFDGTSVRTISKWKTPSSISFAPYLSEFHVTFINDGLFAVCFAESGGCSLTIFDTTFSIQHSTNDGKGAFLTSYASAANQIAYISDSAIVTFNLADHTISLLRPLTPFTNSLEVSPNADFIVFAVSENHSLFFLSRQPHVV